VNAPQTDHPFDLQVLAAFAEGTLDRDALPDVIGHVSHCKACREIVAGAAAIEADHSRHSWWKYAVAAAILIVIIGGTLIRQRVGTRSDPIAVMASAAPVRVRSVEPRLSGFEWAPYRNVMGNSSPHSSGEELVARGVAGRVLNQLRSDDSARGLHAKGVAHLLRDDAAAALSLLRKSARLTPLDARVWNDLAAALYIHDQDDAELREALGAARRAVHLDPRLSEAYFNVALVLERIGSKAEIRAAWTEYLRHDSTSGWAEEARNRLAIYRDGS
jgi:tetratricopeptide (TPR) repeat protein